MNLEVARAMLEGAPQYWPLLALVGAGVVLHAVLRTFLRVTLREGEGALSRLQSYPGRLAARWAERLDATAFECGSLA
jgi:hypothetical protein